MTHEAAMILKVNVQQHGGILYAASPDLPGLHVCGENEDQLFSSMMVCIKELFRLNRGMDVQVAPVLRDAQSFPMGEVRSDRYVVQHRVAA